MWTYSIPGLSVRLSTINNSVRVIVVKFCNVNFYYNLLRRLEFYYNQPKLTCTLQEHLPSMCPWSVAVIGLRNWNSLRLLRYALRPKTEIYNWDRFSSLRYWRWGRRNSFCLFVSSLSRYSLLLLFQPFSFFLRFCLLFTDSDVRGCQLIAGLTL